MDKAANSCIHGAEFAMESYPACRATAFAIGAGGHRDHPEREIVFDCEGFVAKNMQTWWRRPSCSFVVGWEASNGQFEGVAFLPSAMT